MTWKQGQCHAVQLPGKIEPESSKSRQAAASDYRTFVESNPHGIVAIDPSGIINFSNSAHDRIFGCAPGEMIGSSILDLQATSDAREELRRLLGRIVEEESPPEPFISETLTRDGRRIWTQVDWNDLRNDLGAVTGLISVVTDITDRKETEAQLQRTRAELEWIVRKRTSDRTAANERLTREIENRIRLEEGLKESEARYRGIFENTRNGVAVYRVVGDGENFVFVDFNGGGERIERIDRKDLIGRSVLDAFPGVKEFGLFEVFQRVWKTGRAERFPIRQYRDNRIAGWRDNFVYKLSSGEIVAVYSDETKQKKAEEYRKQLEGNLHRAQKIEAIGSLAGGIAHDFNNILSAMIGYTELALDDAEANTPLHAALEQVLSAGIRAGDLVKQILAFSRHGVQAMEPLQAAPMVKEAVKMLRSTIPATISIQDQIADTKLTIKADPIQIHQVLVNLATNAAHAMEDEGGSMEIGLARVSPEEKMREPCLCEESGEFARITVGDSGAGIPPMLLERIFDPYFTTKKPDKGSGLGLAVVQGIVKSHKGQIAVRSERGVGTTFHVYLPLAEPAAEEKTRPVTTDLSGGDETILFIDDEPAITSMQKEHLERLGYEVTIRSNGLDGLDAFRTEPDLYDLVITDMTMPKMPGDALVREIKAIRPATPVILCTGFSEKTVGKEPSDLNFDQILMKPVSRASMAAAIRQALDG